MEKEQNSWLGIIGAILGGLIATIPWILVYIFGNMMFSLLAIVIAFGALKGYQLFHGKMDKKVPLLITIISILSVSFATLIIIPLSLLYKEGYQVSFDNLKILYRVSDFRNGIIKDFVISVIFTFMGISGVVTNLKKQLINLKEDDK